MKGPCQSPHLRSLYQTRKGRGSEMDTALVFHCNFFSSSPFPISTNKCYKIRLSFASAGRRLTTESSILVRNRRHQNFARLNKIRPTALFQVRFQKMNALGFLMLAYFTLLYFLCFSILILPSMYCVLCRPPIKWR